VPWLSSSDIQAGVTWQSELQLQLQESRVGIICLTRDNLNAPWLHFEAGALSKALGNSYVCPYLFGFQPSELTGPLPQFQAVPSDKEGTKALVFTLNRALGEDAVKDGVLDKTFERWWSDLSDNLASINKTSRSTSPQGDIAGMLQSVIESVSLTSPSPGQQRVFVIHGSGRDAPIRQQLVRFLERIGLSVIVFDDFDVTIIEKIESFSHVDYVIALLTGDEMISGDGLVRLSHHVFE
jgi:hypothetical protein